MREYLTLRVALRLLGVERLLLRVWVRVLLRLG
jgi:hypothetical protein